jgi:hypothetical protein
MKKVGEVYLCAAHHIEYVILEIQKEDMYVIEWLGRPKPYHLDTVIPLSSTRSDTKVRELSDLEKALL